MSQQRDLKAKGCQSKGMSQQRDGKARAYQSKGMSQQRHVKAMGCHSNGMSKQLDAKAKDATGKGCQSKIKQRDVKAKGCHSKGMSKQRDAKARACQNKEMLQQRDAKGKGCHSKRKSKQRDVTAVGCHSKGVSKQGHAKANGCQSNGMSKQWDVTAVGCHSNGMSQQRDVKAKGCQSKGMSQQRDINVMSQQLELTVPASFLQPRAFKFERCLARKLRFHIFHFHFLSDVSHESFVFTSSAFRFWGTSRTKASSSHLKLSLFEGSLAWKLRFHIFHCRFLRQVMGSLARHAFWKVSGCKNCCVLQDKTCLGRSMGKLFRPGGSGRPRLCSDHGRIGPAVELPVQASFSRLELSRFEGSLARKLRCHIFPSDVEARKLRFHIFHHLPLSDFEGCLARKLRFHIFHFEILRDVSHKSFVFTSETFTFWGMSRTKASFSHLPLSDVEDYLAQKLHFSHFPLSLFWGASHESFVLHLPISDFEGRRTKALFSHLPLSDFEGCLARKRVFTSSTFTVSGKSWEVSHGMGFGKLADARIACFAGLQDKTCLGRSMGKLFRPGGSGRCRLCSDHGRIGPAVELPARASFSRLELSKFEGSLARKLRFHIFPSDVEARKPREN